MNQMIMRCTKGTQALVGPYSFWGRNLFLFGINPVNDLLFIIPEMLNYLTICALVVFGVLFDEHIENNVMNI